MKLLAWILTGIAIYLIVVFIVCLIGHYTIGSERIIYHIGGFAIAYVSFRCARWIIDKITKKHEQV